MKSKWRCNTFKKFVLIVIGILMFMACSYVENVIKPDGGNPLLKDLRVTRTWAPTGSCISTLDAKWVEPEAFPEVKKLMSTGGLTVAWINRNIMGWAKNRARVYGASSPDHAASLWVTSEPIRDLIDLAIPAEEVLALEWWDTYSQYRIIFTDETAADIDKLASYIDEIIAKDAMPKGKMSGKMSGKWRGKVDIKNKKRGGSNGLWHVGKEPGDMSGPHYPIEYIRPSSGGPHPVSGGTRKWAPKAYPSAPGPRPMSYGPYGGERTECLKALTELVDNLVRIANRHGLDPSDELKQALFNRFAETECNKPTSGGGPLTRGYSDKDKGGV